MCLLLESLLAQDQEMFLLETRNVLPYLFCVFLFGLPMLATVKPNELGILALDSVLNSKKGINYGTVSEKLN